MEKIERIRKVYKKPQVNQVKLVIEEAVLAGCKINPSDTGQTKWTCDFSGCKYTGTS